MLKTNQQTMSCLFYQVLNLIAFSVYSWYSRQKFVYLLSTFVQPSNVLHVDKDLHSQNKDNGLRMSQR